MPPWCGFGSDPSPHSTRIHPAPPVGTRGPTGTPLGLVAVDHGLDLAVAHVALRALAVQRLDEVGLLALLFF